MTTTRGPGSGMLLAGRYRLVEPLPDGRSWRARDEIRGRDLLARQVALPQAGADRAWSQVRRDAAVVARRPDPRVVHVVDAVVEDGAGWVLSELPTGVSLGDVVRLRGPLPPTEVARIGLEVLDALAAAGARHGDLTPEDVLMQPDGRVLVGGFATAAAGAGTAGFQPPEGGTGPDADLWALGVTLFVAVEGRLPRGTTRRAGALGPALKGLLAAEPARRVDAAGARALLLDVAGRHGTPTYGAPVRAVPGVFGDAGHEAAARERAAAEDAARQRAARQQAADQAARERAARERAAIQRAEAERSAAQRAAAERAAQERAAAERAEAERAQERAAQERARERAAQERATAERAAQERAAQERAARERAAAELAAHERAVRERVAAERAAREQDGAGPAVRDDGGLDGEAEDGVEQLDPEVAEALARLQAALATVPEPDDEVAGDAPASDPVPPAPAPAAAPSPEAVAEAPTVRVPTFQPAVPTEAGDSAPGQAPTPTGGGPNQAPGPAAPTGQSPAPPEDGPHQAAGPAAPTGHVPAPPDGGPHQATGPAAPTVHVPAPDGGPDPAAGPAAPTGQAPAPPRGGPDPATGTAAPTGQTPAPFRGGPDPATGPAAPTGRVPARPDGVPDPATGPAAPTGRAPAGGEGPAGDPAADAPTVRISAFPPPEVTPARTGAAGRPAGRPDPPVDPAAEATTVRVSPFQPPEATPDAAARGRRTGTADAPAHHPGAPDPDGPTGPTGPTDRTGRRRVWVAAAAAVAVLLAVLVPVLLRDRGDGGGTAAPTGAPTTAAPPSGGTPSPGAADPPPAGYRLYQDPAGWSVAVPAAWQPVRRGTTTAFLDQDRTLTVSYRPAPSADPYDDMLRLEPVVKAATPGYDLIRLAGVAYRGWPTSSWEYTAGTPPVTHTLSRTFVPNQRRTYTISLTTAQRRFAADRVHFDVASRTFSPDG